MGKQYPSRARRLDNDRNTYKVPDMVMMMYSMKMIDTPVRHMYDLEHIIVVRVSAAYDGHRNSKSIRPDTDRIESMLRV